MRSNYDEDGISVSIAIRETAMVITAAYEFCELDAYVSVAEHRGLPAERNP